MAYSGAWRQQALYPQPHAVHTADPAHQHPGVDTPPDPSWVAPVEVPPGADYLAEWPGVDWWAVVETPGQVPDQTPVDHRHGFDAPFGATDQEYQAETLSAHSEDLGTPDVMNYAGPDWKVGDERQVIDRFESPVANQVNPVVMQRGNNGWATNNPPLEMYGGQGFRRGLDSVPMILRRFFVGERVHHLTPVTPNDAWVPPDQLQIMTDGPGVRDLVVQRTPPPLSEGLMTDGEVYSADLGGWVVG